jgi:ElaB/YqjD/DUF883 family membrane-anchored ribosome-binding protein
MASTAQFGGTGSRDPDPQHEQKQPRERGTESGSLGRMSEVLEEAGAEAGKMATDARHMAEEKAEALMAWIKQRPLQSVLIGAAIGYLFGRMARR